MTATRKRIDTAEKLLAYIEDHGRLHAHQHSPRRPYGNGVHWRLVFHKPPENGRRKICETDRCLPLDDPKVVERLLKAL